MVNLLPTVLYSCMIGMVFLALFETLQKPKSQQGRFFIGVLVLLLIHQLGELFIYSAMFVHAPWLAGAQLPFRVLLGPALYFFAHAAMSADRSIERKWLVIAVTGPLWVLLAMSPFIFMITSEQKLALAEPATRNPELWQIAVYTCLTATCIFIVYTALFLFKTIQLHESHRRQLMERFSDVEQRSLDWFRPILILWGSIWMMFAIEFTLNALGWRWFGSGIVLPILELFALVIFIQKAISQKPLESFEKGMPRPQSKREAILEEDKMRLIASKLQSAMTDEQLYLEENLSLNKLSEFIAETENNISETLSQLLKTNFFKFVNGYRIEAAKLALLQSDKLITSIAYDVGFNSKSTFNTAFKNLVGLTPSAYKKSQLKN